jgi:hypothetical protein
MPTEHLPAKKAEPSVQLKVRTGLRSGDMQACEGAIKSWKSSYDKWYLQALDKDRLQPPSA